MTPATIDELAARSAIAAVHCLYTHAIDRRRWDLLPRIFHPDATIHFGRIDGDWHHFADHARRLLAPIGATHHQLGNQLILVDGDGARSECYVTAYHLIPVTTPRDHSLPGRDAPYSVTIGARYLDRFERRGGQWRIAERHGLYEWRSEATFDDGGLSQGPVEWRGAWGDADPSAALIGMLPPA